MTLRERIATSHERRKEQYEKFRRAVLYTGIVYAASTVIAIMIIRIWG